LPIWAISCALALGVDVVFRMNQRRHYDFRRGQRLGRNDHIVEWVQPQRHTWMDAATYHTIPETLTIRELRFNVERPGFRKNEIVMATTLVDDNTYAKDEIADLYLQRWHAELDLRSIKQTLGMDELVCKTPAMARKEFWAYLPAYNLARKVAAQAALERGLSPRQISFAGTVQTLEAFGMALLTADSAGRLSLCRTVLIAIATHRVGDRPGRFEPRRLKRRRHKYPLLTQPRARARQSCRDGQESCDSTIDARRERTNTHQNPLIRAKSG